MNSQAEILSLLDLLDLDEELVDNRLKAIMVRSNYTNKHLTNALQLLRYKHLINMQEKTDCNNAEEFNFVAKLVAEINADNVDNVCRIINTVLELNKATLVNYSEHLLLQILSIIDLDEVFVSKSSEPATKTLLLLKICDSILDAAIRSGEKPSLLFLETSLEQILCCHNEQLKIHFITSTVPKLVKGIQGYDILSRIWNYLEQLLPQVYARISLKVLSSLSEFYLPVSATDKDAKFESTIIYSKNFWNLVLYGLTDEDPLLRKISVYLSKRAVDYVSNLKTRVHVKSQDETIFLWDNKEGNLYKNQWDNFFILIDSLEEKQSNIVLPSLKLFETLTNMNHCWINCAYYLGLRHDNSQVRLKTIDYRIKTNINSDLEAVVLLGALNDISFYENIHDSTILKEKLLKLFKNESNLAHILEAIPQAHLSPVPFYYISDVIANLDLNMESSEDYSVPTIVIDILKTSCNIVAIREAIHFNIAMFVGKSCKKLHWRDVANIYSALHTDTWKTENALHILIKTWDLKEDKQEFYEYVTKSYHNMDIGMIYLNNHLDDIDVFMEIIFKKGKTIKDVINRSYSNKFVCFDDVMYILSLQSKASEMIKDVLPNAHKMILQYMNCLLSSNVELNIDKMKQLFSKLYFMQETYLHESVLQLYKTAILLLQDPQTELDKMVQSILIVDSLSHNFYFVQSFRHEMLDLKSLLQLSVYFEKKVKSNAQSIGRLRNAFYETHCKLVSTYLGRIINTMKKKESAVSAITKENGMENKYDLDESHKTVGDIFGETNNTMKAQASSLEESVKTSIIDINLEETTEWKEIIDYAEKVMDCGGYGCLEWILKIINDTYEHTNSHLNIVLFINKAWNEIEELKSSNHYLPCIKEFVNLICQTQLFCKQEYNNTVILYCSKIIEYGIINNGPLYYLVNNEQFSKVFEGENEKMNKCGHLVYILSEILLFCPVPRKDQRIADNLTLDIIKTIDMECSSTKHFNFAIQYQALKILSTIREPVVLQSLTSFIKTKIDQTFKAKFRYHGNSQIHRTLQMALQHLLYIKFMKHGDEEEEWYLDLLGRMPHQPSVRISLEWLVALQFYMKKTKLDQNLLNLLQSKKVPLTSQMIIVYWLLKRRLQEYADEEFHFVMRMLLSHTMGQMFNVRLLAQYLAIKLHNGPDAPYSLNTEPIYDTIINVISKTLEDNASDKNLIKLKEDYFVNEFNIVANLTPFFIYHTLPRICEVGSNEAVDNDFVFNSMKDINTHTELSMEPEFKKEWVMNHKYDEELIKIEINGHANKKIQEELEAVGIIQKKYIPWKNMSDINVYNVEKKRESPSDLIVVASLIDKLPNLGGMARTSEVFGVKTYVIDSLRHIQDRQFQGLSVSAERWLDVEEVRPGSTLKEYLNSKKAEGYSVVAAEQTSSSSKLQTFKFPRKTLLLLGHEKEGIPCDLLPMMDYCVEIPQQGYVRSLNVHVTAAIFVWEYARQNTL